MSARVDADAQAAASAIAANALGAGLAPPVAPVSFDPDDRWGGHSLPNDHPAWMRDSISISQRARALLAQIKPVVLSVIGAWDHRLRSIFVGGRRVSVDPSGSYRLD
jgi:hypothetical protein